METEMMEIARYRLLDESVVNKAVCICIENGLSPEQAWRFLSEIAKNQILGVIENPPG